MTKLWFALFAYADLSFLVGILNVMFEGKDETETRLSDEDLTVGSGSDSGYGTSFADSSIL